MAGWNYVRHGRGLEAQQVGQILQEDETSDEQQSDTCRNHRG